MSHDSAPVDSFDVILPDSPYPGLRPFEKHEWAIFFGREQATDEVIGRLIQTQFLVVHGDSGCGKSSLLQAGVLARLEQESARGGMTWRTCVARPRNAPMRLLAESLAELDGRKHDNSRVTAILRTLHFGRDASQALSTLLRRGESDHICLLVDQFEELFAFAKRHDPDEARLFVDILVGLLEDPPPGVYAVVTMRSEFLGACAQFPGLAGAVNRSQYLLPRMSVAAMRRAICEPATLYSGRISLELTDRLILDAGGRQDELPLIQHGLMALYRRKVRPLDTTDWSLQLSDYTPAGGLARLLSEHADQLCEHQDLSAIEKLFRALTDINAEGQATRRPRTLGQLVDVVGVELEALQGIMKPFRREGASFLTPFGEDPIGPEVLVDISHEALIRCWSRLSERKDGWLIQEFQDGLIWRSLLVQAGSFERNASNILSPATAREREDWLGRHTAAWAERYGGGWDRVERMVRASVESANASEVAERARAELRIAELELHNRVRLTITRALGVTVLIVLALAAYVWWSRSRVQEQRDVAESARKTAEQQRQRADAQTRTAEDRLEKMRKILLSIPDKELRDRLIGEFLPAEAKTLTGAEEVRLAAELAARPRNGKARGREEYGLKLWQPGSTLRIHFLGGTPAQQNLVRQTAPEWTKYANIKFQFGPDQDAEVRIKFDPQLGSWSYVGTDALGISKTEPTMNLGYPDRGSILHEFGHLLGLIHENNSPNAKLPWNKDEVYATLRRIQGWSKTEVDRNVFVSETGIKYRPFDQDSIMMFSFQASFFTDGRARGGKNELSASDKQFIRDLYPPQ